jgi:N-acetylmuramoyl-L-alanine amidase
MNSSVAPPGPSRPVYHPVRDTFHHLQVVILVAFVLATLFTAWTPAGLLPGNLGGKVPISLEPLPSQTPEGAPTATPRTRPLIGIVAGHSGNDSGSVCADGFTEAQLNMDVATRVQKDLIAAGLDVDLLKEFDHRLTNYQATALVSIHADSCDYINDQATGFKVASALANPRPERAARLTACLRNRYAQATNLPLHNSITIDMTSYHAFDEINPETTAAIIEVGFLNLDRQLLTQKTDLVAKGVTDGILCFIRNEDVSPSQEPVPEVSPSPQPTP